MYDVKLHDCSAYLTAVPSHTEGVVGLLDATEGFPYGMPVICYRNL